MKKVLLILTLICITVGVSAQNKVNVPKTYVSASISPYAQTGVFEDVTAGALEVGIITYGTKVGLAVGTTTLNKGNGYIQLRVTPTLWKSGNFSVAGSLGGGTVFNTSDLLIEYGGSVNYDIFRSLAIEAGYGVFHYRGNQSNSKMPFFKTGLTFSF